MSHPKVGNFIYGLAERDAIHIAVAPVSCKTTLNPGERVKFVNGSTTEVEKYIETPNTYNDKSHGIVDPFLKETVRPKDVFWVFLNPGSTVGLRHEYVHPAFLNKDSSEEWLRNFCTKNDCVSYDTVIKTYNGDSSNYEENDEYITFIGEDAHCEIPDEFWYHLECVLGKEIPNHRKVKYFSCTC